MSDSYTNYSEKMIPIIPIRDGIVFPHTESILTFGRPRSLAALETAFAGERVVCFVLQKNPRQEDPEVSDLYQMGTIAKIERMIRSDDEVNALVKGISRAQIVSFSESSQYLQAVVHEIDDFEPENPEIKALMNHLTASFKKH